MQRLWVPASPTRPFTRNEHATRLILGLCVCVCVYKVVVGGSSAIEMQTSSSCLALLTSLLLDSSESHIKCASSQCLNGTIIFIFRSSTGNLYLLICLEWKETNKQTNYEYNTASTKKCTQTDWLNWQHLSHFHHKPLIFGNKKKDVSSAKTTQK